MLELIKLMFKKIYNKKFVNKLCLDFIESWYLNEKFEIKIPNL